MHMRFCANVNCYYTLEFLINLVIVFRMQRIALFRLLYLHKYTLWLLNIKK